MADPPTAPPETPPKPPETPPSAPAPESPPEGDDEATWERLRGIVKEEVGSVVGGLEAIVSKAVAATTKEVRGDGRARNDGGPNPPPARRRRLLDIL